MWVWFAAVWAAWAVVAVAAAAEAECPAECRCSLDSDGLWSGECAPSVLSAWPPPTVAPLLMALRLKAAAARHKPVRLRVGVLSHRFPKLKALHLANASLAAVPSNAFAGLEALNLLDLSFNRLRNLGGSAFLGLPSFHTLILRGNPALAVLPSDPLKSSSLRELDLAQCGLTSLPTLKHLPALQRLAVDGNRLTSFDPYALPRALRTLDLAGNSVADVPPDLQNLRHLKHVDLRDNPVVCTCGLLIMHDWLSGNGVTLEAVCAGPSAVAGQLLARVDEDALCRGELGEQMLGDQPSHDAETLFSNENTRRMGTHMEAAAHSSWAESTEGSGDGSDLLDDSSAAGSPRSSFEFIEGSGEDDTSLSITTDAWSSNNDKYTSEHNIVSETDDFTTNSEEVSSTEKQPSTTEEYTLGLISSESTLDYSSSTISEGTSTSDQPPMFGSTTPQVSSSTEYLDESFIISSSTSEPPLSTSTAAEESSPTSSTETPSSSSSVEFLLPEIITSEERTSSSSTTPPIIVISTDSSTEISTEEAILVQINNDVESSAGAASSSEEVEGATEAAAAAAGGIQDDSGWGAVLIVVAVIGPLAILGATAAWRRRRRSAPRKLRLDGTGGGVPQGAELQDMGPLLPQPVQPPAQVLPPEERPLNLSNGAAPVRATARLTVLPDSVPRTPVFVHKSVVS